MIHGRLVIIIIIVVVLLLLLQFYNSPHSPCPCPCPCPCCLMVLFLYAWYSIEKAQLLPIVYYLLSSHCWTQYSIIIITVSRLHANTRIVCLKLQGEVGVLPYNRFLKQMAMFWKINGKKKEKDTTQTKKNIQR
jgi:hypothetical protein